MSSLIPKPRGRPPKNKQWDPVSGVWIAKKQQSKSVHPKKIKIISWNVAGIRAIIKKNVHEQQSFEQFFQDLSNVPSVKLTKGIDPMSISDGDYAGKPNPHAWMSLGSAITYVDNIAEAFKVYDPKNTLLNQSI